MTPETTYCLDTSFFINGWGKRYCRDVFPAIWDHLDQLIFSDERSVFSCREVFDDLAKQKDALYHWAKGRKDPLFREATTATIDEVSAIMQRFPNIAYKGGAPNASDPWVIAHAKTVGAVVVTDEVPAPNRKATKPPKMPDVCEAIEVQWLRPIDFFRAIEIKFERRDDREDD